MCNVRAAFDFTPRSFRASLQHFSGMPFNEDIQLVQGVKNEVWQVVFQPLGKASNNSASMCSRIS